MSRHILIAALLSLFSFTASASAAPVYNIVPLGLDDPEHTRNDGYKYSTSPLLPGLTLNEAGQVIGYSNRYNGGSTALGQSVWLYDGASTIKIGLTGLEYTVSNGVVLSIAYELNEAGQVVGYSPRYNGGSIQLGQSVWLYDGAKTINIGLTDSEHTRINGGKVSVASDVARLNEAGQVIGYSYRYNGGVPELGLSSWLYNGATTIKLGYTGPEYTRNDGYKRSDAFRLNEAGQVIGISERYNGGSTYFGTSAWLYNGATTIELGFTGPEYTRSDGYKASWAVELNQAGQVSGYSQRYNGGTDFGNSVWLYNGANTIPIGLTGPEHTRNDGYKASYRGNLNEVGQVVGYSYRYNDGSTQLGFSAWRFDGATTIDIGLTGPEHTRNDGYKSSDAALLNEAGQVSGYSRRYNGGSTDLGESAWLYDGATTIAIGLTGPEHTRNNGYKASYAGQLNEAGQVVGSSYRYNGGSTDFGQSAWLYDGATTIDIGLTGAEYTHNDGYKASFYGQLNEAGQVTGMSNRYNGGSTYLGWDAWFYDPTLDQTFALQLSERSDGYASSYATYLGDDGLMFGYYTLFDALDNNLGNRAFSFTIAGGLHDLGSLVEGGLPANGWDSLARAIRANGLGQILGHGDLASQSGGQFAYLLTPVPEPSTFALAAMGLLGIVIRHRRRLK